MRMGAGDGTERAVAPSIHRISIWSWTGKQKVSIERQIVGSMGPSNQEVSYKLAMGTHQFLYATVSVLMPLCLEILCGRVVSMTPLFLIYFLSYHQCRITRQRVDHTLVTVSVL